MSATAQTPAIKLEKTVDLERVFEQIERDSTWALLNFFDKWPLDVVREKVIRRLLDRPHEIPSNLAERVEEQIRQLRENHERDYWRGLLSWYIANSPLDREAVRAIEFAISFSREFNEELDVAKEVSGRLKRDSGLYWEVPSLRQFINKLIYELCPKYPVWQWTQVERAIRRVVQVCDITYLPQIENLLDLLKRGIYKLREHEGDEFTFGQNLQFLKDAVRILKQDQQEQTPDLNVVVGSYLREQAGLVGSVIVRIEYQQESDTAKLTVPMKVVVKLELTDPTEAAKLAPVLGRCHIEWWGEGFSGTKVIGTNKAVECVFNDQLQCGFSTFPSRGNNRFWLTFFDGKKEFAKVARYLIVG